MATTTSPALTRADRRRVPGCPPARLTTHRRHASSRVRGHSLTVFHPDLSAVDRGALNRVTQAAPTFALIMLLAASFATLTALASLGASGNVWAATAFGMLTAFLAGVAFWGAMNLLAGLRQPRQIRSAFAAAYPGEDLTRTGWIDDAEHDAVAVAQRCVSRLSSGGPETADLHQRLWVSARGHMSRLDVLELRDLLDANCQ